MADLCTRCALRLQKAGTGNVKRHASKRAFSNSLSRRKGGIPTFAESSNPDLNDVLNSMRTKHFVPAYLHKRERKLIFGDKYKTVLADNPQVAQVGDEEIELQHIDRRREIPKRLKLTHEVIDLMSKGETKDWSNLPGLLAGLKKARTTLDEKLMEKITRRAVAAGQMGTIIQCLMQSERTGLTLTSNAVLTYVIWGLHDIAQSGSWSAEAVAKAIRDANQIALLLESKEHGGGRRVREHDARTRPEVIGVFLELAAVQAYKHQGGQDADGKVEAYASRLMTNIGGSKQPLTQAPPATGPVYEMLQGFPIWHGLSLAQKVLGNKMPQAAEAAKVVRDYEAGLKILVDALEAKKPAEGTYGHQVLDAWRSAIRD